MLMVMIVILLGILSGLLIYKYTTHYINESVIETWPKEIKLLFECNIPKISKKLSIPKIYVVSFVCCILWISIYWKYSLTIQFFCYSVFCSLLVTTSITDVCVMRIPNNIVIYALLPAGILVSKHMWFSTMVERRASTYSSINPIAPVYGLLPCFVLLLFSLLKDIARIKKASIGMGDIKLIGVIGLILGLQKCMVAVILATMIGAFVGIVLLITKRVKYNSSISFAPFIAAGVYIALLNF